MTFPLNVTRKTTIRLIVTCQKDIKTWDPFSTPSNVPWYWDTHIYCFQNYLWRSLKTATCQQSGNKSHFRGHTCNTRPIYINRESHRSWLQAPDITLLPLVQVLQIKVPNSTTWKSTKATIRNKLRGVPGTSTANLILQRRTHPQSEGIPDLLGRMGNAAARAELCTMFLSMVTWSLSILSPLVDTGKLAGFLGTDAFWDQLCISVVK